MAEGQGQPIVFPADIDLTLVKRKLEELRREAEQILTLRMSPGQSGSRGSVVATPTFGSPAGGAWAPQIQEVPFAGAAPVFVQGFEQKAKMSASERRGLETQLEVLQAVDPRVRNRSINDAIESAQSRLGSVATTPSFARLQASAAREQMGPLGEAMTLQAYAPLVGGSSGEAILGQAMRKRAMTGEAARRIYDREMEGMPAHDTIRSSGVAGFGDRGERTLAVWRKALGTYDYAAGGPGVGSGVGRDAGAEVERSTMRRNAAADRVGPDPALVERVEDMWESIIRAGKEQEQAMRENAQAQKQAASTAARAQRNFDAADFAQEKSNRQGEFDLDMQGIGHRDYDDPRRLGPPPTQPPKQSRLKSAFNFASNRSILPTQLYYAAMFGVSEVMGASNALSSAVNDYAQPTENLKNLMSAQAGVTGGMLGGLASGLADKMGLTKAVTGFGSMGEYRDAMNYELSQAAQKDKDVARFSQLQSLRYETGIFNDRSDKPLGLLGQLRNKAGNAQLTADGNDSGLALAQIDQGVDAERRGVEAHATQLRALGEDWKEVDQWVAKANDAIGQAAKHQKDLVIEMKNFADAALEAQTAAYQAEAGGAGPGEVDQIQRNQVNKQRLNAAGKLTYADYMREVAFQSAQGEADIVKDQIRNDELSRSADIQWLYNQGRSLEAKMVQAEQEAGWDPVTMNFRNLQATTPEGRAEEFNQRADLLNEQINALTQQDSRDAKWARQGLEDRQVVAWMQSEGRDRSADVVSLQKSAMLQAGRVRQAGGDDADTNANTIINTSIYQLEAMIRNMEKEGLSGAAQAVASGSLVGFNSTNLQQEPTVQAINRAKDAIDLLRTQLTGDN